jgi:type I restriction enzyme, S subunit
MGREMATSQDFVNWICGEHLDPIYLMWALRVSRPYLLSKASGSTHKTIYYQHAEQFQVHLPPIADQRRFAAIVESVDKQKPAHRKHLAERDTLFALLQSRAFRGEL